MTSRTWKAIALHAVLGFTGVLGGVFAHAEMILQQNTMVTVPSVPTVNALGLSAPGQWSITVSDLAWSQSLQSLSFAITNMSGVLASRMGAGTLTFDVVTPMNLFATVFAIPNAAVGAGIYHINIAFTPSAPPVPLPAAVWLLLSGMCGLATLRRKHATVTNSVVQ